ncbi:hypothetical protein D3C83_17090 [compost metagenome]
MLKRNIAVLMIAGGVLGAQVNLAAASQDAFPSSDRSNEPLSAKVSYLDGRAKTDIHASRSGSDGSRGSDSSPFPWDNSKD